MAEFWLRVGSPVPTGRLFAVPVLGMAARLRIRARQRIKAAYDVFHHVKVGPFPDDSPLRFCTHGSRRTEKVHGGCH